MLTLRERAESYHISFSKYPPLMATDRWLYGMWLMGNTPQKLHGFYGEYPPSFLERALSLFPDCEKILHLFSGIIQQDTTLDINPSLNPTIVGDAQSMPLPNESFDLILADPPYGKTHAEKYGYPMIGRRKVFRECWRVLKPDGFLGWLDTLLPMYRKDHWQMVGSIGIIAGTNRAIRGFTIYQKRTLVPD